MIAGESPWNILRILFFGAFGSAYDFGMKYNIMRRLRQQGFKVQVVPATTPAAEAMKFKPAGIFLSNGPGDPAALGYAVQSTKDLIQNGCISLDPASLKGRATVLF